MERAGAEIFLIVIGTRPVVLKDNRDGCSTKAEATNFWMKLIGLIRNRLHTFYIIHDINRIFGKGSGSKA